MRRLRVGGCEALGVNSLLINDRNLEVNVDVLDEASGSVMEALPEVTILLLRPSPAFTVIWDRRASDNFRPLEDCCKAILYPTAAKPCMINGHNAHKIGGHDFVHP